MERKHIESDDATATAISTSKESLPIPVGDHGLTILEKRYLRKGADGKPIETPAEMFRRVARTVAAVDAEYGGDASVTEETFYRLLTSLRFLPNSPTFTGAGTPLGQLAACFTAGMRVTTREGLKRIAELEVGDLVLTHSGRYRPVTGVFQRPYQGKLLRVRVKLIGTPLEMTPEHPVLTPRGWVEARHLQVGDLVAIGIPRGIVVQERFDLAALPYAAELEVQETAETIRVRRPSPYQRSGRQARWANRFLDVTPALARLCGYYVAEGTIGPDDRYVRFIFSKEECAFHEDVLRLLEEIFDLTASVTLSNFGNWVQIDLYSRAVAVWFREQFGTHSYGKRIPIWLQFAPPEIQQAFLVGLFRGDGLFYERKHQVTGRTAPKMFRALRLTLSNPSLVQQVWQMALRLGYNASIRPTDTTYVTPTARSAATVSMPPLQSRDLVLEAFGHELPEPDHRYIRNVVTRIGDQVFFPIKSIEAKDFSGIVYNCEVEEDHSYVTEGVVVHNCFVLPIEDDMGKEPVGIFQTLRDAALIQQTGGGVGFSFSRLRPKGDRVASSGGIATGPVGFLKAYDTAFGVIAQGGIRRGACMAVLRVDHPDIEEFIRCKTKEGAISNFNISVGITDAFMQAVLNDEGFDLVNPRDGRVWKTVRARELFHQIAQQAHHNGEPGVLFLDAANRCNPVPHLYAIESTNPCGEQPLGPYENCCLGSINLARHLTDDDRVDWEKLRQSVELATHFLDNVIDANGYVPAVPQLRQAALRSRRIGLGIMGLADMMYRLGIRYGSEEAQEFAGQVMEFIRYHSMKTSIALARERGPFPAIKGSIYDPSDLKWQPPTPLMPYRRDFDRPPLDWDEILEGIRQYGIRNAAQNTIAPTGTVGTVAGCEGYGCEPVFALAYTRTVKDNDRDLKLTYTSPLFEKALVEAGLDEATRTRIMEGVNISGSCQDIPEVPESIRRVFVVAQDITPEEHVRMQAALQAFVDASISKTINFPRQATVEDVETAYKLAWELGCKGLTVYVTGSRQKVVLETQETAQAREGESEQQRVIPPGAIKPRPGMLRGVTFRKATPMGTAFITINENGEGHPFEVFLNVGKAGSDTAAVSEALGRLISLILRLPSTLSPLARLRQVVAQLAGIGGRHSLGFGANRVRSLPDAVAQVLAEYLGQALPEEEKIQAEQMVLPLDTALIGDLCPECGQATFITVEGCRKCYVCGFSEC